MHACDVELFGAKAQLRGAGEPNEGTRFAEAQVRIPAPPWPSSTRRHAGEPQAGLPAVSARGALCAAEDAQEDRSAGQSCAPCGDEAQPALVDGLRVR